MTYQAPRGWRLPPRGPQHAAPFGSTTPLVVHAHRALRLFVTAGAWAAGLCLVTGLVALVAEAAGPAKATHVAAAAGSSKLNPRATGARGGPGGDHGGGAGQPGSTRRPGTVLRAFAGTGNRTTGAFSVTAPGRWDLHWSFQCAPRAPRGGLIIREGGGGHDGLSVDAAGSAGTGSTSTYSATASHYLVIITSCSWKVRVVSDH
ncbi:MAG TPA: hypothetical protein VFV41_22775 [Streptosporangiaceae bacterium]|nr:hypothetical protein [Streptosporangiaceae bacterium]